MSDEEKVELKWFEVTWTITEGRSHVKAESEAEAKKLASDYADQADIKGPLKLEGGRIVQHEWYNPADQEPYISDVEQDTASDVEGASIEAEMEEG